MATDLAEIKVSAIDQASAILANIKGKADDLTKSADSVKGAWNGGLMDGFTKGGALAATAAIGAIVTAVGGAGAYFYSLAKSVMEAQAGLKNMAEVTGASVEGLSAIRTVAKLTGIDMETVAGGLTKMAKTVEVGGASTEAALKSIGLSLKDLQGLKTDEQFLKITGAMNGYADGAGKTAAAQLLLGKSGAQLLPLMKDIGEAGELVTKTTTAQAVAADDLEKNIKRLTLAKEAWKKVVGTELVPVLDDVVKVLLKVQTETNGTLAVTKGLAADGSIKEWGRASSLAVARFADELLGLKNEIMGVWNAAKALPQIGEALLKFAAAGSLRAGGDTTGAGAEYTKQAYEALDAATKKLTEATKIGSAESDKYTKALTQQFAETDAAAINASVHFAKFGDTIAAVKPKIADLGKEVKERTGDFDKLAKALADLALKTIQIKFEIDQDKAKTQLAELESQFKRFGGTELSSAITAAQNAALDAFENNAKAKLAAIKNEIAKFTATAAAAATPAEKNRAEANAVAERAKLLEIEKEIESTVGRRAEINRSDADRERELMVQLSTGLEAVRNGTEDYVNTLTEAGIARTNELNLMGLSKDEQERLNGLAKIEATIRSLNVDLWRLQIAATYEMTQNQRDINKAAQEGVQLKINALSLEKDALPVYLESKRAKEEELALWKSVSDTATNFFADLFQNGKSAFGNLWTLIKKFFADLAAQFAVKYVLGISTGQSGGIAGSVLSSIMGGGSSSGGSGLLGSLGGLLGGVGSSIISGLGSVFGSAGTIFAAQALAPLTAISNGVAGFLSGGISGAASAMGGLAGILGTAVPVVGALVAALSAFGVFDRKPGFKLDNSVVGVGNSPDHFTQSALGSFDVSTPVDQTKFDPLRKAIQALDAAVAGALGPDVLLQVKANIQALKNATQWENLDAAGIEKATKDFLKQRYGTAFDAIDASVAATIRGFAGTADELMKFIDNVVAVTKALKDSRDEFAAVIGEAIDVAKLQTLAKEGESLTQTLTRVVTVFAATNNVALLMGKDIATAFGAVGLASLGARQNLIDLAGGIQNLTSITDSYYKNYFSDSERAALELTAKTDLVKQTFKDLGLANPKDVAEFRRLVESLDLTTETGRTTWVALMKINGIFYDINTSASGASTALAATYSALDAIGNILYQAADYSTSSGPGAVSSPSRGDKGPSTVRQDPREVMAALPPSLQGYLTGGGATGANATPPDSANQAVIDATLARRNLQSLAALVLQQTSEQANSQLANFNRQRNGLQDLMNMSNRSAGALASVVGGMQSMRDATAQLLLQIQQVKAQVSAMFGDTIQQLKLSTMTNDEKYAYYQQDAEAARNAALSATDALEIQRQAARVNADINAAQALLTPEQRAATNPQQIANLEAFNTQVQNWLDAQTKTTTDNFDTFMDRLGKKFDDIVNAQAETEKKNSDAADRNLIAATTPLRLEVDFRADIPGVVTTVEVGG